MSDYLQIVDHVVMEAYSEGFAIPKNEVWNIYAVKHRLMIYGKVEVDGRYYLNEFGLMYVLNGCSEGLKRKQIKDEYIDDLNIEATKKAMNDADRAFIQSEKSLLESKVSNKLAKWALGVSIAAVVFQMLEHILRGLLQIG